MIKIYIIDKKIGLKLTIAVHSNTIAIKIFYS